MDKQTGKKYFTKGLNMDCQPVVSEVEFVRYIERKEHTTYDGKIMVQDCVIKSDGIKVISNSSDLFETREEVIKTF